MNERGGKKFDMAALNIAMFGNHAAQEYSDLFNTVINTPAIHKFHGKHSARFYEMSGFDDLSGGIKGTLCKFLDLRGTDVWFDSDQGTTLDSGKIDDISNIRRFSPEFANSRFTFFPETHTLFFQSRTPTRSGKQRSQSFSPMIVRDFFQRILKEPEVFSRFGLISVSIIQGKEGLEKIFSMYRLQKLHIEITPPNPDETAPIHKIILNRMKEQNLRTQTFGYTCIPGSDGIKPDKETREICEYARENGFVKGEGKTENGKKEIISTMEHPEKQMVEFDDELDDEYTVFSDQARHMNNARARKNSDESTS